ncbi:ABC transporter substrate-binding protein [Streptomyces sp. NBC_01236]|uniref:ABC transporter substrate-binding protein n=1 Tax=Streptomyces sp. NBC_01236 TaxID=2903789 RepID=UPI002E161BCA|nr:ABC transporter substrate-binding protein [Streptomyces sp. NBC_01236]
MRRLLIAALVLALAGCSARSATSSSDVPSKSAPGGSAAQGDFGTLKNVCHDGSPKAVTSQGVTTTDIKVGVFSDVGFTKNPEFVNAAKVFTSWCNDAGGINGRQLVPTTRDAKLFEGRQRMIEACREDFALVGGGTAFDGTAVKDRLKCLLPEFPAQSVQLEAFGADLSVQTLPAGVGYASYPGYYSWLIKEAYPDSAGHIGIISGDIPTTKVLANEAKELLPALGGKVTYTDLYPAAGVADWTPYAQTIKSKKLKGLIFNGDFASLAKLEQALTNTGYKLDWVDANNNAYGPAFIKLAGTGLDTQTNFADLSGFSPLEQASGNPATKKVVDLFAKYAPGAQVTLPALRAFSAWLLFASAASDCAELTRKCVYDNTVKQKAWTGGGLQAPADLTSPTNPPTCFNVVKATSKGWTAADFKPDQGAYRCDEQPYKYKKSYGKPATLADVGKSMADLK